MMGMSYFITELFISQMFSAVDTAAPSTSTLLSFHLIIVIDRRKGELSKREKERSMLLL
jgi:hypothetical protein